MDLNFQIAVDMKPAVNLIPALRQAREQLALRPLSPGSLEHLLPVSEAGVSSNEVIECIRRHVLLAFDTACLKECASRWQVLVTLANPNDRNLYWRYSTMSDNPNKETENPPLDHEDWQDAFEPYAGQTDAALMLGFNFKVLLSYLTVEPIAIELAVEGIERAIDALYPHTQFHQMCHEMFLKVVGGELTLEEEETLKKMGLKF